MKWGCSCSLYGSHDKNRDICYFCDFEDECIKETNSKKENEQCK